ncbi:fluoride efflux transporter FluC [Oligoflexus tunisiensis]|uniref:fluoride efflux transporter FluC n=1 Tax=Oligoflexus tunisiensis TaxID=708132 RepID=UPI00114D1231|nr:CrcB family protein [Oligoflexus tunisiensis]
MQQLALVIVFGALGVTLRYGISLWALKAVPQAFPWATFVINIVGAFLMGVLYVLGLDRISLAPEIRTGLAAGFLGGFTTFSAYCNESLRLWEGGERVMAALYYFGSPAFGLLACYGGVALMRTLERA